MTSIPMYFWELLCNSFLQRVRIAHNADHCHSQSDSVCLSVRPSHSGVLSRRMKI